MNGINFVRDVINDARAYKIHLNDIHAVFDCGIFVISLIIFFITIHLHHLKSFSLNLSRLSSYDVLLLSLTASMFFLLDFIDLLKTCGIIHIPTHFNHRARYLSVAFSIILRIIASLSLSYGVLTLSTKSIYILVLLFIFSIVLFIISHHDDYNHNFDIQIWAQHWAHNHQRWV